MSLPGGSRHTETSQRSCISKRSTGGGLEGGKGDHVKSQLKHFSAALSLFFASSEQPPQNITCLEGQWILLYMLLKGSEKQKTSEFNIGSCELQG